MVSVEEIRKNTKVWLSENRVPLHPYLPLLDFGEIRNSEEVCRRIVSLYALAGLANGADKIMLRDWLMEEDQWKHFSQCERSFFEAAAISDQDLNELSWKSESLFALCWAGQLAKAFPSPKDISNLSEVFTSIPPERSFSALCSNFALRDKLEILKHLDFYYCLHAAAEHPELWENSEQVSKYLKIQIVVERRHALEWICCNNLDWAHIALDT